MITGKVVAELFNSPNYSLFLPSLFLPTMPCLLCLSLTFYLTIVKVWIGEVMSSARLK
jgi:hypothetical protein